jgi:hypothetical protein
MPYTRSKYEFHQEASLSQQLAKLHPEYAEYAGSDPKISKKIARLKAFVKLGYVTQEEVTPLLIILDEDRKAAFATSERTNEITKMGLQMPKSREEFGKEDEDDSGE